MRNVSWTRLLATALSGAVVFQTASCIDTTSFITAISTSIAAGGVIYLVSKVME